MEMMFEDDSENYDDFDSGSDSTDSKQSSPMNINDPETPQIQWLQTAVIEVLNLNCKFFFPK